MSCYVDTFDICPCPRREATCKRCHWQMLDTLGNREYDDSDWRTSSLTYDPRTYERLTLDEPPLVLVQILTCPGSIQSMMDQLHTLNHRLSTEYTYLLKHRGAPCQHVEPLPCQHNVQDKLDALYDLDTLGSDVYKVQHMTELLDGIAKHQTLLVNTQVEPWMLSLIPTVFLHTVTCLRIGDVNPYRVPSTLLGKVCGPRNCPTLETVIYQPNIPKGVRDPKINFGDLYTKLDNYMSEVFKRLRFSVCILGNAHGRMTTRDLRNVKKRPRNRFKLMVWRDVYNDTWRSSIHHESIVREMCEPYDLPLDLMTQCGKFIMS